jgi:nicotinate phosphoribosyltransferase
MLVPIFRADKLVYQAPALIEVRQRAQTQIRIFHSGVKRFVNPHEYPVGLELGLPFSR